MARGQPFWTNKREPSFPLDGMLDESITRQILPFRRSPIDWPPVGGVGAVDPVVDANSNYEMVSSGITSPNLGIFTDYLFCPGCLTGTTQSSEAFAQVLVRQACTIEKLAVRVTANTGGTHTIRTRKNGVNGNLVVTIGANGTGWFRDDTNVDTLAAGDLYAIQCAGGVGAITVPLIGLVRKNTNGDGLWLVSTSLLTAGEAFDNVATYYVPVMGRCFPTVTEADARYKCRDNTTISNMRVYVVTNTAVGDTTVRFRRNGANGAQVLTIAGGATGSFEDTTNSDRVLSTDTINYSVVVPNGLVRFSIFQSPGTACRQPMAAMSPGAIVTAANVYVPIYGNAGVNVSTNEADAEMVARTKFTASRMFVYVPTNASTGTTRVYFRRNRVSTPLSVSIGAGATGIFEDTTNSVVVNAENTYDCFINHGGGAAISITAIAVMTKPTA